MSKSMAIVIIIFWVSFAFISALFNYNGSSYQDLVSNFVMSGDNNGIVEWFGLVLGFFKFMGQSMTLTFPDIPLFFTLFIILLQIISALVIIWALMENLSDIAKLVTGFLPK